MRFLSLLLRPFLSDWRIAFSKVTSFFAWVLAGFALAFVLVSCGGGGGEGGVSGGGTGGGSPGPLANSAPASSFGSVVGLGSIFVGEFEFDDSPGKVTAQDGLLVSATDLGLGVQVSVVNEKTSQTLSLNANNPTGSIQIKRLFLGVLQANGESLKSGLVNGQVVYFDRRTAVIGATSVEGLRGVLVQVAGYLEPTLNQVVVTRIERATAAQVTQNQIYITAQVQSVDAATASVSVGFATVSLGSLTPTQEVKVNDIIRVQGSFSAGSMTTLVAARLSKIQPTLGFGGATFRGVVNSRPTAASPRTPLIVDGYEVQILTLLSMPELVDLRRGSVVEVQGTLDNTVLKNASLIIISNPKVTLPNEEPAPPDIEETPVVPRPDYRIFKSPIQEVFLDGSFKVRGVRVMLAGGPPSALTVGQIVSIAGEASADSKGFFVIGTLQP